MTKTNIIASIAKSKENIVVNTKNDDEEAALSLIEQAKHDLEILCRSMAYARSWYFAHEKQLLAAGIPKVSHAYDHFVFGGGTARTLAEKAGLEIDFDAIARKDWSGSTLSPAPEVGPQPPYVHVADDIGINEDASVEVKTPQGSGRFPLETVLRSIDLFMEPGRSRMLACLPSHYSMGAA